MLSKPIPELRDEQWKFLEERLDKPAPEHMQKRLRHAIENTKKMQTRK